MTNDSSTFIFKNAAGKITNFQNIIHRVDTVVTDIGETEDYDFKSNGYIIINNTLTAKDISKIIIYYQKRKVSKIAFYVETYDDMGNYVGEEVLFWAIYR